MSVDFLSSHCVWWKAIPLCDKSECRTQCPSFAATTTAEGADQLKGLLLGIYSEQLYSRPKPPNNLSEFYEGGLRGADEH